MKQIKIKFVGFWDGFNYNDFFLYRILKRKYDVQVVEDADYVICSVFGKPYAYCEFPQIRIMYSGENYVPDFNLVDYAVCEYPVSFLDRNYFFPGFASYSPGCFEKLLKKERNYTIDDVRGKKFFANFVCSHDSENNIRGDFFKKLSHYKRIESAGSYLNNMPQNETVSMFDGSKYALQKKCKFTLCFESTRHEGFITEKIADAFFADTIPIYYGSSTVSDFFNPDSFIDCSAFGSFDEVIDRIIQIDRDDRQYLRMLNAPVFVNKEQMGGIITGLEEFLYHIFDQPIETAYRRSRVYVPQRYNDYLLMGTKKEESQVNSSFGQSKLINIIKKCLRKKQ